MSEHEHLWAYTGAVRTSGTPWFLVACACGEEKWIRADRYGEVEDGAVAE